MCILICVWWFLQQVLVRQVPRDKTQSVGLHIEFSWENHFRALCLGCIYFSFFIHIFKCLKKTQQILRHINSLLQSVQTIRANIDMCNFVNCFILPYKISTFNLNGSAWALGPVTRTERYRNTDFTLGDDPCAVLDQYFDGEEFGELIMKEKNVSDNDLP